jgi:hypothetical protein
MFLLSIWHAGAGEAVTGRGPTRRTDADAAGAAQAPSALFNLRPRLPIAAVG